MLNPLLLLLILLLSVVRNGAFLWMACGALFAVLPWLPASTKKFLLEERAHRAAEGWATSYDRAVLKLHQGVQLGSVVVGAAFFFYGVMRFS